MNKILVTTIGSMVPILGISLFLFIQGYIVEHQNAIIDIESSQEIPKDSLYIIDHLLSRSGGVPNFGNKYIQNKIAENLSIFNNGNFNDSINQLNYLLEEVKGHTGLTIAERNKIQSVIMYLQVRTYLNQGNYENSVEINTKLADSILGEIKNIDPALYNSPYGRYAQGYSQEIRKNYKGALEYYKYGLDNITIDDFDMKSILENQIGHIYNLLGMLEDGCRYYHSAHTSDPTNYRAAVNIGRCYIQNGDLNGAIPYIEQGLKSKDLPFLSEIYYTLSSIYQNGSGDILDIKKSITYAQKSIETYKNYPMGYVSIARGLYIIDDKNDYTELWKNITTAIHLNPRGYEAFEIGALHLFDKGENENAIKMMELAISNVENDSILMASQKPVIIEKLSTELLLLQILPEMNKNKFQGMDMLIEGISKNKVGKQIVELQLRRNEKGIFGRGRLTSSL